MKKVFIILEDEEAKRKFALKKKSHKDVYMAGLDELEKQVAKEQSR